MAFADQIQNGISRMEMMQNRETFYAELIEEVRNRPSLWDKTAVEFNNHAYNRAIWKEIGSRYNMTVETIKSRWKNIRDSFRKAVVRLSTLLDKGGDASMYPRWKHYDSLMFLRSQLAPMLANDDRLFVEEPRSPSRKRKAKPESSLNKRVFVQDKEGNIETYDIISLDSDSPITVNGEDANYDGDNPDCNDDIIFDDDEPPENGGHTFNSSDELNQRGESTHENGIVNGTEPPHKKPKTINYQDDDYHFLLSLLPYLRDFPKDRKMIVRTKIQQMLWEEVESIKA